MTDVSRNHEIEKLNVEHIKNEYIPNAKSRAARSQKKLTIWSGFILEFRRRASCVNVICSWLKPWPPLLTNKSWWLWSSDVSSSTTWEAVTHDTNLHFFLQPQITFWQLMYMADVFPLYFLPRNCSFWVRFPLVKFSFASAMVAYFFTYFHLIAFPLRFRSIATTLVAATVSGETSSTWRVGGMAMSMWSDMFEQRKSWRKGVLPNKVEG